MPCRLPEGEVAQDDRSLDNTAAASSPPNPFWLASAPPANSGEQIMRAFDARLGRGGVEDARHADPERVEPLRRTDYRGTAGHRLQQHRAHHRPPLEVNFREIYEVKKRYPSTR
jgi:dihydropyrimidine dehydrogenase (NAD+) subunit PreA